MQDAQRSARSEVIVPMPPLIFRLKSGQTKPIRKLTMAEVDQIIEEWSDQLRTLAEGLNNENSDESRGDLPE